MLHGINRKYRERTSILRQQRQETAATTTTTRQATRGPPARSGHSTAPLGKMSLVDEHGEWEEKKISFFGAVRSFVSNLKLGQDMTRLPMPAV
jgi:hypothetical protein